MTNLCPRLSVAIIGGDVKEGKLLKLQIENKLPDLKFVGLATTFQRAKTLIANVRPNLVLLDAVIENQNSFDLLDLFPKSDFKIIFITKDALIATRVFDYPVVACVNEPMMFDKLTNAFVKAKKAFQIKRRLLELEARNTRIDKKGNEEKDIRVIFPSLLNDNDISIDINYLIRCEADGDYTNIFMANNENGRITIKKGISECEKILIPFSFMRIHRSHLVNLAYVEDLSQINSAYQVKLSTNEWIPVARRRKTIFRKNYKEFQNITKIKTI